MAIEILDPGQVEPGALGFRLRGVGLGLQDELLCCLHPGPGKCQAGRRRRARELEIGGRGPLVGLRGGQIRTGLGEHRLEIAGIDLDHELPGRYLLIVGGVQRHHAPADDLRCHGDHIAVDERIVGRDQGAREPPISGATGGDGQKAAGDRQPDPRMAVTYCRHWLGHRVAAGIAAVDVAQRNDSFCHWRGLANGGHWAQEKRSASAASFENACLSAADDAARRPGSRPSSTPLARISHRRQFRRQPDLGWAARQAWAGGGVGLARDWSARSAATRGQRRVE